MVLLRNLDEVTVMRKPYFLLYAHIIATQQPSLLVVCDRLAAKMC